MTFDPPQPGTARPAPSPPLAPGPPPGPAARPTVPPSGRSSRRSLAFGAAAGVALLVGAFVLGFPPGGAGGGDRGDAGDAPFGDDVPALAAGLSAEVTHEGGVSDAFIAADPTDAVALIAPAPWCDIERRTIETALEASAMVSGGTPATSLAELVPGFLREQPAGWQLASNDDGTTRPVPDPLGPCASLADISTLPNADDVLLCRAEEAAILTAAERATDAGLVVTDLDSLIPRHLVTRPLHWEISPPSDEWSVGVVPRAVGSCSDLVPKLPAESRAGAQCAAEYAIVTTALESYVLEFGVAPSAVADLAPTYLTEAPVAWTLDPSGSGVVPVGDGRCAGFDR